MDRKEIKYEIESLNAINKKYEYAISLNDKRIEEIQDQCLHEETGEDEFEYGDGFVYTKSCLICEKILEQDI